MDIFISATIPLNRVLLVAVRTRVVRGTWLLIPTTLMIVVVVVFLSREDQLVALPQERRGPTPNLTVCIPTRKQVCRLSNRRNHLLCRLDRVVWTIVLHCHLEVRVHHPIAPTHVDSPTRVQSCKHSIHPSFVLEPITLLLNYTRKAVKSINGKIWCLPWLMPP